MDPSAASASAALARGDLLAAHDLAASAILAGDSSPDVRHVQVLALARLGDSERARELFAVYGLGASPNAHHRAAGARLLKDLALLLEPGSARDAGFAEAFAAYDAIFQESGDPFPGINAATMALLAGKESRARRIAATVGDRVETTGEYYSTVTRAEAFLILGRTAEAGTLLASQEVAGSRDHGAKFGTSRQLAMIADHLGLRSEERRALLAPLAPPLVAHGSGHMFAADSAAERALSIEIGRVLDEERVGFLYGALACGGDILLAEAALARGTELHVVLPFDEGDFIAQSVLPGGEAWADRYQNCRRAATSFTLASGIGYFGDPAQYGYGSRIAMGLARLRARHIGADVVQVAIWDGAAVTGPAGTGADVRAWTSRRGRVRVVDPGKVDRGLRRPEARAASGFERVLAAIVFTDFAGFSTLSEDALPAFWSGVMQRVADALDAHGDAVQSRNSWGDALYAVLDSAPIAARLGLELQAALADLDYSAMGLDGGGRMRIGIHYGPAFRARDPITGRITFYGTEISRTARIEPVTPPGAVFVTEPFAAIVALEASDEFACHYVGRLALAKKYGEFPMYRLARATRQNREKVSPAGFEPATY